MTTTITQEDDRETGRKMAEVDYVIGAPFATTWQNVPRTRAFWAGYAIGWIDAEEVALAKREMDELEAEREEWIEHLMEQPSSDYEAQWELDREYEDLMGADR